MPTEQYTSPMTTIALVLALGVAPALGMAVAGGWGAAFAFVATAWIVFSRTFAKTQRALRDPEVPIDGLSGAQAMAMMAATRGRAAGDSALGRVEALRAMAKHDPERAHRELVALVDQGGNNLAALVACTDIAFELGRPEAHDRWAQTLASALDRGINRLAAMTFAKHAAHRDALVLDQRYRGPLAAALAGNGEPGHAQWVRSWANGAGNSTRTC